MQTRITEMLDYGVPGEMGKTNPSRVDSAVIAADVVMGGPIGRKSNGDVGPYDSTYSTYLGIGVSTHQHVSYGVDGVALAPTLSVKAGATIGIVTMGDVHISLPLEATPADTYFASEAAAKAAIRAVAVKAGDGVYVTSAGVLTTSSGGNTLVGKIIEPRDCGELADGDITLTGSSTTVTKAAASLTVMVRIG